MQPRVVLASGLALLLAACGGASGAPAPTATAVPSASVLRVSASPVAPSDQSPSPASVAPAPTVAPADSEPASIPPLRPLPPSQAPAPQAPAGPATSAGDGSALSPALTITNADDGKSFQVRVGQVVDVALTADSGMDNWQVANPTATILAPTVNPAAAAVRGVTLRAFKAVGAGTATIEATDRPSCGPGQACPHFVRAFKATVVVAA